MSGSISNGGTNAEFTQNFANFDDTFRKGGHPIFQMYFGPDSSNNFNFKSQTSKGKKPNAQSFFTNKGFPWFYDFDFSHSNFS